MFISPQAKGTATPSVAATLIERLPDESDSRRAEEETIAKDVVAVAYAGMSFPTIFGSILTVRLWLLGGADTVSE